ncbi:MAG: hypothetical protein AAB421_03885 [Patescibacteria group bacterium]
MVATSKSPKAVALVAYTTAKCSLQYSHLKGLKKFTQHQLVVCLVLKEFFRTDYRGVMEILQDSTDLRQVLELEEVPHYTSSYFVTRKTKGGEYHQTTRYTTFPKVGIFMD